MDGLPCEFYKFVWDTIGDDFSCLAFEVFSYDSYEFLNRYLSILFPRMWLVTPLGVGGLSPCLVLLTKLWPRHWPWGLVRWHERWLGKSTYVLWRDDSFLTLWFHLRRPQSGLETLPIIPFFLKIDFDKTYDQVDWSFIKDVDLLGLWTKICGHGEHSL